MNHGIKKFLENRNLKKRYKTPKGLTYYPYLLELIENNHVLIAGTTGSGKSVLENAIIYAILCCKFPFDNNHLKSAKLILIDPKKVELWRFKKLPHTLLYASSIDEIIIAFQKIRALVDFRLNIMLKHGLRKSLDTPVYVFIDELVDIVTSKKKKEAIRLLSDIASISRATNIFFIALTQSPSRIIIPASFKLLFNCKVALRCNENIESRQIIGDNRATLLPLHGQGIVKQDLQEYMIKIPLYHDYEIDSLVKFWEKQTGFFDRLFR